MKIRAALALALFGIALLVVPATRAVAQEEVSEVDPTLTGYYVAVSVGGALEQFSGINDYDNGFGGDFSAGYRASEYLSVELQAQFFENFAVERAPNNEIDVWLTTIDFKLHFPFGRIEPYLTYGGGVMGIDSTSNAPGGAGRFQRADIVFKGGGGLAYQLTDSVSLYTVATYALPIGSARKYEHAAFTVGAVYKWPE